MVTTTRPFTVAIVDDDPAIRRLVKLFLHRSNYSVLECTTAGEARKLLGSSEWDVAVLDRRLPDSDGASLAAEMKSNNDFRNRYVIMLTGEDEERDKIEGLDLGADDYMTKPFQPAELLARIRAGKRIVDLQNELLASNRRLALLSITDGLTQLYNHRHFQEELARTYEEAARYQRPLSLALIDLDFFKKINDTWGHAAGDQVLQAVSRIFHENIRASDLAARYGGEEFAVMMPETNRDDAIAFAEKIRAEVEHAPIHTDAGEVPVTVSIGLATYPKSSMATPRELIESADRALYRAKRGGAATRSTGSAAPRACGAVTRSAKLALLGADDLPKLLKPPAQRVTLVLLQRFGGALRDALDLRRFRRDLAKPVASARTLELVGEIDHSLARRRIALADRAVHFFNLVERLREKLALQFIEFGIHVRLRSSPRCTRYAARWR